MILVDHGVKIIEGCCCNVMLTVSAHLMSNLKRVLHISTGQLTGAQGAGINQLSYPQLRQMSTDFKKFKKLKTALKVGFQCLSKASMKLIN